MAELDLLLHTRNENLRPIVDPGRDAGDSLGNLLVATTVF